MALDRTEFVGFGSASLLRWIGVAVALISCQISLAQSADAQTADSEPLDQSAYVEETVVTGQRSLSSQRVQLESAQNGIFDLFNEIYAGTDYEMVCEREAPVKDGFNPTAGSWTVRTCRSSFVRELRDEAAEDFLNSAEGFATFDEVEYEEAIAQHKEETASRIRDLYEKNPEFREQFTNYVTMRTKYEAALEADAEKGNFFTNLFRSKGED